MSDPESHAGGIDPSTCRPVDDPVFGEQPAEQAGERIDLDEYERTCICVGCGLSDICVVGRALSELLAQAIADPGTGLIGVLSGCSRFEPVKDPDRPAPAPSPSGS